MPLQIASKTNAGLRYNTAGSMLFREQDDLAPVFMALIAGQHAQCVLSACRM